MEGSKMKNLRSKNQFYLGFLGLISLLGLRYFSTGDVATLCWFGFMGYFAYFWISRIGLERLDERYYDDVQKAKAFSFNIATWEMAVLFILALFLPGTPLILGVSFCLASLPLIYSIKLYLLEER